MSRVIVTGAAGFLGSHLCDALLAAKHQVVGIDNLVGGTLDNLNHLPDPGSCRVLDCCDLAAVQSLFETFKPEIVYHLAAHPHEGLSVFSPTLISQSVYLATVAVATAAIATGVKRLVFTSSTARWGWGDFRTLPFAEDTPAHPADPYGIAKLAAEQLLLCLGHAHDTEVVIAIPHNIYGPKQRYWDPYRNVVGIMVNRMLQGQQPIIYGDGHQRRCFSFVSDCVEPLVKMGFQTGLNDARLSIGPDDHPVTIIELATILARLLKFKLEPIFVPARPCEVKEAWPSAERARRVLDYQSRVPLEEGLSAMIAWIKEKGPRPFDYHLPIEIPSAKVPKTWSERLL